MSSKSAGTIYSSAGGCRCVIAAKIISKVAITNSYKKSSNSK
jgi:hypothetical protein